MEDGTVVMNRREQKTYQLALEVMNNRLTLVEFSILIEKSYRQSQRILNKIRGKSLLGVKHGNLGRKPKNKINDELKRCVLDLLRTRYYDFNLTHFSERLLQDEGILIKRETLRKWAASAHLVKRAKRRNFSRVHKPRPRMPRAGMLIQFDGSEHNWFSGNGPVCTLLGGIDDATGEIVGLEFFPAEDTFSCLKAVHDIVAKHGLPEAFYVDQGTCFGKIYRDQSTTQLGRALEELGCRLILATSPQAKGRIERLWNTLQDRLIAELRIRGINRIPRANEFLKSEFIESFNQKFTVVPREPISAFKKIEVVDSLRNIFCIKEPRKIGSGNVFNYNNKMYVVNDKQDLKYRTLMTRLHHDNSVSFEVFGKTIDAHEVETFVHASELRKRAA